MAKKVIQLPEAVQKAFLAGPMSDRPAHSITLRLAHPPEDAKQGEESHEWLGGSAIAVKFEGAGLAPDRRSLPDRKGAGRTSG